jgi:hypothetical protein
MRVISYRVSTVDPLVAGEGIEAGGQGEILTRQRPFQN